MKNILLLLFISSSCLFGQVNYNTFKYNRKVGLMDKDNKKEILEPIYNSITREDENTYILRKNIDETYYYNIKTKQKQLFKEDTSNLTYSRGGDPYYENLSQIDHLTRIENLGYTNNNQSYLLLSVNNNYGLRFPSNISIEAKFHSLRIKNNQESVEFNYDIIDNKVTFHIPEKYISNKKLETFKISQEETTLFFDQLSKKPTNTLFSSKKTPYEFHLLKMIENVVESKFKIIEILNNRDLYEQYLSNLKYLKIDNVNLILFNLALTENYYDDFTNYKVLFEILFKNKYDEYLKYSNLYLLKLIENNELEELKKVSVNQLKKIEIPDYSSSNTLLYYAIVKQKPEIVKYLVSIGYDKQKISSTNLSAEDLVNYTCFNSKKAELLKALNNN